MAVRDRGLVFFAGILGTAHHYYWVGVPQYWLPIGGFFSALEPLALAAMAIYAYAAIRRSGFAPEHARPALDHRQRGVRAVRCRPAWPGAHLASVNKWTHGTLITAMHGHAAFFGAYAMIVMAMITYACPA
jgi:nitric oxide reductase subunit B